MRLLDLICSRASTAGDATAASVPAAGQFAPLIRDCPLRFVLADDLVRCATALAYAEGERLGSCLDLIHVPAQLLWIEWAESPRLDMLRAVPALAGVASSTQTGGRAGALVAAQGHGRRGIIRTLWSNRADAVFAGPLLTHFDLDRPLPTADPLDAFFEGGSAAVTIGEAALDELLSHVRYQLDPAWAAYYRAGNLNAAEREAVLRANLSTTAFDAPMLFAFFLLLSMRDGLPRRAADLERLNRARARKGKPALLEHVEVAAPIEATSPSAGAHDDGSLRSSPRLHHVRGHLVRRGTSIFWRLPHMRGSARLGIVRSRTVELSFAPAVAARN